MSDDLKRRLLRWLVRYRLLLLALAIVLGCCGAVASWHLQMDRTLERMFAADDPLLGPYNELQQAFGQHNILLVVYDAPKLTTARGLARVKEVAESVHAIPGVVAVVSIVDVPGLTQPDLSGLQSNGRAKQLLQIFSGYTHNKQLNSAGIVCLVSKSHVADEGNETTVEQLRALVQNLPGGRLIGEPVLLGEAFDMLEEDGRRLNTWCLGLLLLTIFICFRRLRWLILPLILVQVALAITRGLLVLVGLELSMVSSMLAAIVTVVGVATVMHVIVRYRDHVQQGLRPRAALLQAGMLLAGPVFFACVTDAVGFGSLMLSDVQPVKEFGLMMGLGSLVVLVVIGLTAPAIVLLKSRSETFPSDGETSLQWKLHSLYDWSRRHRLGLTMVLFGVTNAAVIGSTWLLQETSFIRNFRAQSEIAQDYGYVDRRFGGAGVWDILVPAPRQLDKKYLTKVLRFEARLREETRDLNSVVSLADVIDAGSGGLEKIPFGANMAIRAGLGLIRARMPEFVAAIYNPEAQNEPCYLRILLRSDENLSARRKTALIKKVQSITEDSFPRAQVTGFYVLLTHLIESLLRDQWTTFLGAAIGILLVMTWAFASLRLALVTLIPNVLPVVWLFGAMGLFGIPINMGAAMIAAVSLGLSVDGSIHYLMSYQRLRREGLSLDAALQSVQSSVGRAAVLGTLALVIGFSTLAASEFLPTIYFGTLVSLSMIGGLVGNLIVLPLLIQWVEQGRAPLSVRG